MVDGEMGAENVPGEIAAVDLERADGEEEEEKVVVVSASETVVDPGTMVVAFGDAVAAETAVLGSRWFDEVTGLAGHVWLE